MEKTYQVFEIDNNHAKEIPISVFKLKIQRELMQEYEKELKEIQSKINNLIIKTFGVEQKRPFTDLVKFYQEYINSHDKFTRKEMVDAAKSGCIGFSKTLYYSRSVESIKENLKNNTIKQFDAYGKGKNVYYMKVI